MDNDHTVGNAIRRFVRKLIPRPIRDKAKAVIGSLGAVALIVNNTVPDYSDEFAVVSNVILVIATFLGIYQTPNVPVEIQDRYDPSEAPYTQIP